MCDDGMVGDERGSTGASGDEARTGVPMRPFRRE
jgi:hypothetical protein